jgi:hypothetical protein
MNRNYWIFLAVCAAGAFALMLLETSRTLPRVGDEPADPMLLRVHDVPPSRLADIRTALSNSLSMGEGQTPLGRVSTTGHPGQLLVLAPESIQGGIGDAIAALSGDAPKEVAPTTVVLDLWSIDAVAGEGADDPALAPIAAALAAARPELGAVRFQRRHTVTVSARADGEPVVANGHDGFGFTAYLRPLASGVTARLSMMNPSMVTTLDLAFSEAVVLARISDDEGRTQVIVARARPADARN